MLCSLAKDPADPSVLSYSTMIDVYNTYAVLTDPVCNDSQTPNVDITVSEEAGNDVAGFTEDTPFILRRAV